jgi:hypothetical protein
MCALIRFGLPPDAVPNLLQNPEAIVWDSGEGGGSCPPGVQLRLKIIGRAAHEEEG